MEDKDRIQLRDPDIFPGDAILKKTLGKAFSAYTQLLTTFEEFAMTHEWRYYNDGKAWLCKVQKKKRTIIWMSVRTGFLKTVIYFAPKFFDKLDELTLSPGIKEEYLSSEKTGKSKAFKFDIRDKSLLEDFSKVIELKIACK